MSPQIVSFFRNIQPKFFLSWSRRFFLVGVALSILFVIPLPWFPLQLGKLAIFSLSLFVSLLLFVLGGGMRTISKTSGSLLALAVWSLPLAYLVSWLLSADRFVGVLGSSIEQDTLLFVILCSLAFMLGFALLRSTHGARMLMKTAAAAVGVAALFQIIVIVFGTHLVPFSVFSDHSVNVVGKWNDLGLLAGLLLLLLIGWLEWASGSLIQRVLAGVGAFLLLCLLAVIQFPLVWALVLAGAALCGTLFFLLHRPEGLRASFPRVSMAGVVLAAILLVWGAAVNTGLTSLFPVSALEVRPSFSSTLEVDRATHGASARQLFFGAGPNTFGDAWLLHKPAGVNQTLFWNLNFNLGFSTFLTALQSVGLLGALAWLAPLLLLLYGLVRYLRAPPRREWATVAALSLVVGYFWCALLLYIPSENLLLLAFVFAGAAFGLMMSLTSTSSVAPPTSSARRIIAERVLIVAASVALLMLSLWGAVGVGRRFVSEIFVNQGSLLSAQPQNALALAVRAQRVEKTSDNLRLGLTAGYALLQQLANNSKPSPEEQQQFVVQAQQTLAVGQQAVLLNPHDYQAFLTLGNLYALLSSVGISGAGQSAVDAYQSAAEINPTDPEIPLQLARLAQASGNDSAAENFLSQALTLKPNYTDAILFVVQYAVAHNDIPTAIAAAGQAVQSAPGIPSSWFELGLLYYSKNDFANAIPALEQAVKLENDYANARYFLGLSYAAQGRATDAVAQFENLATTNPNNAEVALILNNLKQGKEPFAGAKPPITPTPQERATAPLP